MVCSGHAIGFVYAIHRIRNTNISASVSLRLYRDLLWHYLKPQSRQVVWLAALLLSGICLQLLNPQVLRYFLDTAQAKGSQHSLYTAAGLFLLFAFSQEALSLAVQMTAAQVGWISTNRLRADLTLHLLRLDLSFHKGRTPGELIDRADGDVSQLANFLSLFVVNVLGNGLLVVGILVLLFHENVWLGLGMLIYTLLTFLTLGSIQQMAVRRWSAERQASAQLYGYIEERISGAEEVRAAGAEAYVMRRLSALMADFTRTTRSAVVFSSMTFHLTNLIYVLGYAAGLAVGVVLFLRAGASLGTVYLITYYLGMLSAPLQSIRSQVEDLQQASANIQRIGELFDLKPQVDDRQAGKIQEERLLPGKPLSVQFRDVCFLYSEEPAVPDAMSGFEPMGGHLILDGISFDLHPGRILGVLGRTGSGKSTLTRLLFRLYDPTLGSISLDKVDLRKLNLDDLRQRVALVTQDVQLFQASIRDNLTFFNKSISDAVLERELRNLRLWDWVQSLPDGLNTPLTGGFGLSAGEAQLLAFTRVFLKDPGLVILDEASSRLDQATEALLEQAVDRLFVGRTGVVIAHRLKTVQRADDILILEEGRIVEFGRRADLANDPTSRFSRLLQIGLEEVIV